VEREETSYAGLLGRKEEGAKRASLGFSFSFLFF
jgi:hypothetical protein